MQPGCHGLSASIQAAPAPEGLAQASPRMSVHRWSGPDAGAEHPDQSRRSSADRRDGGARLARARRGLRRRCAAAVAGGHQGRRRARHRGEPRARQRLRGARPFRRPGRCRPRPFRLSRRRLRLRRPEPHHPGDTPAERRAGAAAAHRPPRHRLVPELRSLAGARPPAAHGPHAGDGKPAGCLVRKPQRAPVHDQGLRRPVQGGGRARGAGGGFQCVGPAARHLAAAHRAQHDGREGGVHADTKGRALRS